MLPITCPGAKLTKAADSAASLNLVLASTVAFDFFLLAVAVLSTNLVAIDLLNEFEVSLHLHRKSLNIKAVRLPTRLISGIILLHSGQSLLPFFCFELRSQLQVSSPIRKDVNEPLPVGSPFSLPHLEHCTANSLRPALSSCVTCPRPVCLRSIG